MRTSQHFKKYLWLWLSASFLLFAAAISINFIIDPYGLFDTKRISAFNSRKPIASSHVRIVKPYQVVNYGPRIVIGGNSRPEIGLDPANPCWSVPVYNFGLPGASLFLQARALQHAIAETPVEKIFWGLDFIGFLGFHNENKSLWTTFKHKTKFEERLRVLRNGAPNPSFAWTRFQDYFRAAASLDSLKDSLVTLFSQKDIYSPTIRRDGFNPAFEYLNIIQWEGQWVLFAQKRRELEKIFSRPGLTVFDPNSNWSFQFESVKRLITYAKENGVSVTLFINPYHVDYLRIIAKTQHWHDFEQWKHRLADLARKEGVSLWDFSLINGITTEPVPPPHDTKTVMRWFWEPAHYRKDLGDIMLSRMLNRSCHKQANKYLFGQLLSK